MFGSVGICLIKRLINEYLAPELGVVYPSFLNPTNIPTKGLDHYPRCKDGRTESDTLPWIIQQVTELRFELESSDSRTPTLVLCCTRMQLLL